MVRRKSQGEGSGEGVEKEVRGKRSPARQRVRLQEKLSGQ
jgi:hypothetical protein